MQELAQKKKKEGEEIQAVGGEDPTSVSRLIGKGPACIPACILPSPTCPLARPGEPPTGRRQCILGMGSSIILP